MNASKTLRNTGLLYLASMLLVVTLGSFFQSLSFSLGLIATELVCILLPALLYLRLTGQKLGGLLPLRWTGWKIALLCLVLGAAVWQVSILLEGIAIDLSGYELLLSPDAYPRTVVDALRIVAALVIAAPICEEILFRGVLMRSYQPYGATLAVVLSSALFAFFHMRLQGLPGLIPVAFLLGWVAMRTNSLLASMLVHMANNAFGAGLMILNGLSPDLVLGFPSAASIVAGVVFLALGIYALRRWTSAPAGGAHETLASLRHPRAWLVTFWPVVAGLILYGIMAASEVVYATAPQLLAGSQPVIVDAPASPGAWSYDLSHRGGDVVGAAQCSISDAAAQELACSWQIQDYDVAIGASRWISGAFSRSFTSRWAAGRPEQRQLAWRMQAAVDDQLESTAGAGGLEVVLQRDGAPLASAVLETGALLEDELPWRLSGLPFQVGYARLIKVIVPAYIPEGQDAPAPVQQNRLVVVEGGESIMIPAGNFVAWRVKIGERQTAWYEAGSPHRLLKYDDGMQVWVLK